MLKQFSKLVTVLNVIYRSKANYNRETGGDLYCNQTCITMLFSQMVGMWSVFGIIIFIIILLIIFGSIQLNKAKKGQKEQQEIININ